jgi:hypothetical protein
MFEGGYYERALDELGLAATNAAKRELGTKKIGKNRRYGYASGTLQKSLGFDVQVQPNSAKVELFVGGKAASYGKFIEEGVNGTKKKYGSPYSYTDKAPPVDDIVEWMKVKPVRLRDSKGRFIQQTDARMRGAAYAIAQAIKRNGIVPVKFFDTGVKYALEKKRNLIAIAAAKDVAISLGFRLE